MTRAVVTAVGAVTPNGLDVASTWSSLLRGESGIRLIKTVDVADLAVRVAGEVRGFEASASLPRRDISRLDRHAHFAVAAADEALRSTGITAGSLPFDATRFAVTIATGSGPVSLTQDAARILDASGPRRVPPGVVVYGGPDAAAAYLSERYGARGASAGLSATCASGTVALGEAMRTIRHGYADAVLVVAADDCLNRVNLGVNASLGALALGHDDAPTTASRPFDRGRHGFVMSAGAAALLVESEVSALARGADILGEIAGYGVTSDAYHPTSPRPDGSGALAAMRASLHDARLDPNELDHVNAHGTSTPLNDAMEAAALRALLGSRLGDVPVTANKSATGHLLGAAGALEAVISLLTMRDAVIPPTLNLDDPEFPELDVVAGEARPARIRTVLSNSFGFGGHNASLLLRAYAA
ncbi:beta-ketoacyl-[acyl-carrier-protein] synthase family protein [Pseudoclavibacter helvolus]|uniref:beta-ketoacyl-[acyl-carrier-protein] synthase family protein n=1 Tax=Pseudoclavibacter helvolus TaxID=255205 RepID=UPI003C72AE0D